MSSEAAGGTLNSPSHNLKMDNEVFEEGGDDAGGLFGSGDEDEESLPQEPVLKRRKLSDEELGSEDDDNPSQLDDDALDGSENEEVHERAQTILDVSIGRQAIPKPSDGELYLLQFPEFAGIDARAFHHKHFQPPTTNHHSSEAPSSTFSAYHTSSKTIRWRHSPQNHAEIQSNTQVLRWSDGSLTLQLASNPREQLELTAKPLAPSHNRPLRSVPNVGSKSRWMNGAVAYDPRLDSHTYLTVPHEHASLIRITNHLTSSLAIQLSTDQNDDALVKLQQSLAAAATKGNKSAADGGLEIINISEDPELAKKKAEVAEKEKLRAQRRRQLQEERERDRANRVLGRSGLRTGGFGAGLTVGGLEDDDGMATTRARTSKPKRRSQRRDDDYSDDDYRGARRSREDEYQKDDGFLASSSDEEAETGDDSEESEVADRTVAQHGRRSKKVESPKSEKMETKAESVSVPRGKRRRVIDDEDDDG